MATTGGYNLDLDNQKRNIFVTQLNERDDDDDIHAFPVVKENGGQLLETGINTLQKTLLLKKQVEVEDVDNELYEKRQEFRQKMEECAERQIEIQKRQQQMKDEFTNCEKYIKDYEAKRRRAIQKYQSEMKLKEQKSKEFEMLCEQLALLKEKCIKQHRKELDIMQSEHDKMKLSINSQLAQLQEEHEHKQEANKQDDQNFAANKGNLRKKRTEFGVIMMAIDNIADKCLKVMEPSVDTLNLEQKLRKIGDHLKDSEDVARMASRGTTGEMSTKDKESSKGSADVHKAKTRRKPLATPVQVKVTGPS